MSFFQIRSGSLRTRLLFSFLACLIIPMFVLAAVFYAMTDIVKGNTLEANLNSIRQTQDAIDYCLKELDHLTLNLSTSPAIQWLLDKRSPLKPEDYYLLHDASLKIQALYDYPPFYVLRYFVVFPDSGIVLSQTGSYDLESFYGYIYEVEGLDFDIWLDEYVKPYHSKTFLPAGNVTVDHKTERAVTLLRSLPVTSIGSPRATVLILLSEGRLLGALDNINTEDGGNIFLTDAVGNPIAWKHESGEFADSLPRETGYRELALNGVNMLLCGVQSDETGFGCYALSRSASVLEPVINLEHTVIGIYCIALLAALGVSLYLSYVNAKPFREIIHMLQKWFDGPHGAVKDEYRYLKYAFSSMIESNSTLREQSVQYQPVARAWFIGKLLRGEVTETDDIDSNMDQLRLDFAGKWYNASVLTIQGFSGKMTAETLKELNAIRLLIKADWGAFMDSTVKWEFCDLDERALVILTAHGKDSAEACQDAFERSLAKARDALEQKYGLLVSTEVSEFCRNLMDIYYVYSNLRDMSRESGAEEMPAERLPLPMIAADVIYYYPVDFEQRLINVVKTGNAGELDKLMDILHHENDATINLSPDMWDRLFDEIRGTVLKLLKLLHISGHEQIRAVNAVLKKMKGAKEPDEKFRQARMAFSEICGIVGTRKTRAKQSHTEEIRCFMQENYMDSSMSLSLAASHFHYSDTNFSHFFKENFGRNFSDYLEGLRIDAACALLSRDSMSLEEVAGIVGYNSSTSFRRAFKRVKGIIPSHYKQLEAEAPEDRKMIER